jgi:anti-sigma factor RsiW
VACAEALRVQAYFDGELDVPAARRLEEHLAGCAECRGLLAELTRLRVAIRRDLGGAAPARLRARLTRALNAEEQRAARSPRALRTAWRAPLFWLGAGSGMAASVVAALLALLLLAPPAGSALADALIGAHLHSLAPPAQLIGVASSDHHTVKPWFAGRADVSPVVADFAAQGFPLLGGRTEALAGQRAAVLVYRHGAHVVNVFSWKGTRAGPAPETMRSGYHLLFFSDGDLQYCAVSDAGWPELRALAQLIQAQAQRERSG